jgi:hypothetical protein
MFFATRAAARAFATKTGRKVVDRKENLSINGSRWFVSFR